MAHFDDISWTLARVGPRLKRLRVAHGLSLARLSELTGISTSTLCRLEVGQRRPALELLLPLVRIYGVTLDSLVGVPDVVDPSRPR